MRAAVTITLTAIISFLTICSTALADKNLGGEGLWGETDDKVVTFAGFILMVFFPLLIFILSMIQGRLEKRKDARLEAEKARKDRADLRGGW